MATEKQIKAQAGYVQVEGFANAGPGYFCGTCKALAYGSALEVSLMFPGYDPDYKDGWCAGLQVPVRTYGCCNNWKLGSDAKVRGANGVRLRVLR